MKSRSPLSLLVIIGIAAILMMPAQFSQSTAPAGTDGDDYLEGTDGQDTINGGKGNDRIFGKGSRDILDGGEGDDMILGGPSADVIRGGPNIKAEGDTDRDILFGGGSADKIDGGAGNDLIFGGGQGDNLYGGLGDDEIHGGTQSDLMFGGPGNDLMFGGTHSDNIFGDVGDDILYGGVKNDNLFAGLGNILGNTSTGTVTCSSVEAGDTVTVNGLVYTAVSEIVTGPAGPAEFSIDGNDLDCATNLALSITDDLSPGTNPSLDPTAVAFRSVVTISVDNDDTIFDNGDVLFERNTVVLESSDGTRLAVSGAFPELDVDGVFLTSVDDQLFGGIGNDNLIGSLEGIAFLDGGEFDDDNDGKVGEDPVDFGPIDNDGDGLFNEDPTEEGGPDAQIDNDGDGLFSEDPEDFGPIDNDGDGLFNEDGPGKDRDVCFWDGGPNRIISDVDGNPMTTNDQVVGDDVLALDDAPIPQPTCETIHVLGIDTLTLGGGKKGGGGGKANPPEVFTAHFVETVSAVPGESAGLLTLTFNTDVDTTDPDQADRLADIYISNFGVELMPCVICSK